MNDLLSNLNLELNNGIKQANTLYELYQLLSVYNVYNKLLSEAENDLEIVCQIDSYLMDNPQISTEEFSMFIDDLLLGIGEQFANDTRVKDTKTRIEEFNKKIYTIAEHPRFQQMTSRDETGRNLYGRVLEFLQTEQYPTGREYKPSKDKRQTMNETDLENRDYNIRKKWLEHFISRYNIPESISANFMVASEQFYENADNTLSLNFGRMRHRL